MHEPGESGSLGEAPFPVSPTTDVLHLDSRRKLAIAAFLDRCGWGRITPLPLPGDASFRRYYRLCGVGRRAVLMDAPPPQEDVVPYIDVSALLRALGFSAP